MSIIDEKKKNEIREARHRGMTYRQIEKAFHVSRYTTVNLLHGATSGNAALNPLLVTLANSFFEKNGFRNVENINAISDHPTTDFIATKEGEKWSINIRPRSFELYGDYIFIGAVRLLAGYRNAVLILDENVIEGDRNPPVFMEISEIKKIRSGGSP